MTPDICNTACGADFEHPALPKTHYVKCWPEPFAHVRARTKLHEVRNPDRGYRKGDTIVLQEWEPTSKKFTGEAETFTVGYVSEPGTWGLPLDRCAFSLIEKKERRSD